MKKIGKNKATKIFIAGATAVGKTMLSLRISQAYPSLVIRTSDVREAIRTVVSPRDFPEIFFPTFRLYEYSKEQPIDVLFENQCRPIIQAISKILKRHQNKEYLCVVEGIHLVPSICSYIEDPNILLFLLKQPSSEEHWSRIQRRAMDDNYKPLSKYEPYMKNIRRIGEYIEQSWLACKTIKGKLNCVHGCDEAFQKVRDALP